MERMKILFQTTNWAAVEKTRHTGKTGTAYWQTLQFGGVRMRVVEYSPGYFADHWCNKGHIVYCLEGAFESELETGQSITLTKGMSYIVSDDMSSHRSSTAGGAMLLIIDGDFLKIQ
jgi:mannose-6-phosphate isomerase class I